MTNINLIFLVVAGLIIVGLGIYAGKLLLQLKQQNSRNAKARLKRIERITESVRTIAMAMEQQQCNLSEGAIRLVNLLHSLPIETPPNCEREYPSLYALFVQVRELPTHETRRNMSPQLRTEQDEAREEHEARLESSILKEVASLRQFSV